MRDIQLESENVLDRIYRISSDSDGCIILTYSISSSCIDSIISQLKTPKKIRIMYSLRSDSQRVLMRMGNIAKYCRPLEVFSGTEHYEISHAKIYVFTKHSKNYIDLTIILGSFNLTSQTLRGIEVYGVYRIKIDRDFLLNKGIENFVDVFNLDDELKIDSQSLRENISGEDKEIAYGILLLLIQQWFADIRIVDDAFSEEDVNYFGNENKRVFVSTFGKNSLHRGLRDLLRSSFIYAHEHNEDVELKIITPFHTEEAIRMLFALKAEVLKDIGLTGKVRFTLKLLTNFFSVMGSLDKTAFCDPTFLKEMMFSRSQEFKVKFWGYSPGNENFIHAKIYVIKVGDKRAFLITSSNLTLSGFGFATPKNLEVGVVENKHTEELCNWVDECWDSEYAIKSSKDRIWGELQSWYDELEEGEEVEEDFEIAGLTDFQIYQRNVLEVIDKRNREIESMKMILRFAQKEEPVRNLEEEFRKKDGKYYLTFRLKEEHLGVAFCDIFARQTDESYIFVARRKIYVTEKFPKLKILTLQKFNAPKIFSTGTVPIEVDVEIGKGISKIDLTKISFELQKGQIHAIPRIMFIKEGNRKKQRVLQFLLWMEKFKIQDDMKLVLLYNGDSVASCSLSRIFLRKFLKRPVQQELVEFVEKNKVSLLTDERTLCPRISSEIAIDLGVPSSTIMDQVRIVRDFCYSELIGMERTRRQDVCEVPLEEKIDLSNDVKSNPPTDVEVWFYGVRKGRWTWLVPIGKLNYQLLKNPPELEIKERAHIKTNVTPVEVEFILKGYEIYRGQALFDYKIGKWKNSISMQGKDTSIVNHLPFNFSLTDLEMGMDLIYRFAFKYKLADIVGNIRINYDFFVSSPHLSNPKKTMMLIHDPKNPRELLRSIRKELAKGRRPFLTIIPTRTTDCKSYKLQLDEKSLEESKSYFDRIKNETFVLKRLDPDVFNQFTITKNRASLTIHIIPTGCENKDTIPFDILYLEGIKTNSTIAKEGQYARMVTIYHPSQYKNEFKQQLIEPVRREYEKYLKNRMNEIKAGRFWAIGDEKKREEVSRKIEDLIEEVKSNRFVPKFKLRRSVDHIQIWTLDARRLIDFILFIRKGRHGLRISVNELLPS